MIAGVLVKMGLLILPAGPVRDRYRRELSAELHDLAPAARLHHATGFLWSAWSLRRAVAGMDPLVESALPAFRSPLHCRWHLYHHYRLATTDDGHRYLRCRDCGNDYPGTGNGPADIGMTGVVVQGRIL